jgi:DNA-binding transcriptional regulator YiaG
LTLNAFKEPSMPNIAAVLKEEIRRLARKEVRASTQTTKHAVAKYRRDIAQLRRQIDVQQKRLAQFAAQAQKQGDQPAGDEDPLAATRYSARSVRAQRKRLGLSAEAYGRLVGVSGLTIYNWEHGKARPRKAQFAALIAIRGIGKREALKQLAAPAQQAPARRGRRKARG